MDSPTDSVIKHTEIPEINTLLVGPTPKVFSARDLPPKLMITEPDLTPRVNPRFAPERGTKVAVSQEFVRSTREDLLKPSPRKQQTRSYSQKIEADKVLVDKLNEKLEMYDRSHKVKSIIYSQDYDEHYAIPLQRRINQALEKENYEKYLEAKYKNIDELTKHPVPVNSDRESGHIELLRYSVKGLHDPGNKYREQLEKENSFEEFLAKANGEPLPEKKAKPLNTLDYKRYDQMVHTRFWLGTESTNKYGRKAFPDRLPETMKLETFPDQEK